MTAHLSDAERKIKVSAIHQHLLDDVDFSKYCHASMVKEIRRIVRYVERLTEYNL